MANNYNPYDPSYMQEYNPYEDGLDSGGGGGIGSGVGGAAAGGFMAGGPVGAGIAAGGALLTSLFEMRNKNKQAALQRQLAMDQQSNALQQSTAQGTQAIASKESTLDPFRSRMSQIGDVAKLDRVAQATSAPRTMNVPGPFGAFVPQQSGGYSYQKSPDLVNAAKATRTSVLSGTPDPSMTNPDNFGKTGALDLIGIGAGTKNPASASAFATGAPSAGSSLGADPVANMVRQGYQSQLGRSASDAEIQQVVGTLSKIYGRQLTAADSGLINGWIQQNLATSPEAMQRKGAPAAPATGGGFTPSYMGSAA